MEKSQQEEKRGKGAGGGKGSPETADREARCLKAIADAEGEARRLHRKAKNPPSFLRYASNSERGTSETNSRGGRVGRAVGERLRTTERRRNKGKRVIKVRREKVTAGNEETKDQKEMKNRVYCSRKKKTCAQSTEN